MSAPKPTYSIVLLIISIESKRLVTIFFSIEICIIYVTYNIFLRTISDTCFRLQTFFPGCSQKLYSFIYIFTRKRQCWCFHHCLAQSASWKIMASTQIFFHRSLGMKIKKREFNASHHHIKTRCILVHILQLLVETRFNYYESSAEQDT